MLAAVMTVASIGMLPVRVQASEPVVVWQLSTYAPFLALEHDDGVGDLGRFATAGSTLTVVPGPNGNAIEASGRSANWAGMDILRLPLNLAPGHLHTIQIFGRGTPGNQVRIEAHQAPWGNIGPAVTVDGAGNFTKTSRNINNNDITGGAFANAFRVNTAAGNDDFIIDEIIVRRVGIDSSVLASYEATLSRSSIVFPQLEAGTVDGVSRLEEVNVLNTGNRELELTIENTGGFIVTPNEFDIPLVDSVSVSIEPSQEMLDYGYTRVFSTTLSIRHNDNELAALPVSFTVVGEAADSRISLQPSLITLRPGVNRGFMPTVLYENGLVMSPTPEIVWTLSGNNHPGTTLQNGFLRIAGPVTTDEGVVTDPGETAGSLTITARLADDNAVYATAVVTLTNQSIIDGLTTGLPVTQYPSLREVYADFFRIGGAGDGNVNTGSFHAGNTRHQVVSHHFNSWTFENSMKPQPLRGGGGGWNAAPVNNTIAGARHAYAGMSFVGHTLAWHSQSPEWMWTGTYEQVVNNMYTHMRGVFERWGSQLTSIDVVNEAIGSVNPANPEDWRHALINHSGGWRTSPLGYDWVTYAFRIAAEIVDDLGLDVVLYYNDFGLDGINKAIALAAMVRDINAYLGEHHPRPNGRLHIEGIGMQGHYTANTNLDNVATNIRRFGELGVKVSFTELSVYMNPRGPNGNLTHAEEILQGQRYAQLFEIFRRYAAGPATYGSPYPRAVERVTFWAVDDGNSWRHGSRPVLFNHPNFPGERQAGPAGGQVTGKEALLAVLDPGRFLNNHPPVPPEPPYNPGIYHFDALADVPDAFTGINIILGTDENVYPFSTAGATGAVAFNPTPGGRYRLEVSAVNRGTYGLEAHWLRDNSRDNFTSASIAAVPGVSSMLVGTTATGPFAPRASMIPTRFQAFGSVGNQGIFLRSDFTMPELDSAAPNGLLGNIAIRGIAINSDGTPGDHVNGVEFNYVRIWRLNEAGQPDGDFIVNWPEGVEPPPPFAPVPGVVVTSDPRGDEGSGATIFIGQGTDVWPYAAAGPGGQRAFEPEPDMWVRVHFNTTSMGIGGFRTRWCPGTGWTFTSADQAVVNNHSVRPSSFGLGIPEITPTIPIAAVVPGHQNANFNTAGTYTMISDILLDGSQGPDQLIGNISLRGTAGGHAYDVNWILVERLVGGHRSEVVEPLVFWPFGLENLEQFRDDPMYFAEHFYFAWHADQTANPGRGHAIAPVGGGAVPAAAIARQTGGAINAGNPLYVGQTLVANLTAGTTAAGIQGGTTTVNLAGNVTYTWRMGTGGSQQIVQQGPDNTLLLTNQHVGLGVVSVQVTSDWEVGEITSANTAVGVQAPAATSNEITLDEDTVVIPYATIGLQDDADHQVAVTVTHTGGIEELSLNFENLNGFVITPSPVALLVGGDAVFTVEPSQAMLEAETPQVFEAVISIRHANEELATLQVSFEVKEEPVCREDLGAVLQYVRELNHGDFTRLSWALLHQVYQQAAALYNNQHATEQEIEDMTARLLDAIDGLILIAPPPPEADKAPLIAAIEYAETFVVSQFTRLNWVLLQDALNHARAVVGNENATQEQVNAALTRLTTAISNRIT